ETLLSRGDQRVAEFLHLATVPCGKALTIGPPAHLRKTLNSLSFDPEFFVGQSFSQDSSQPWDFIDHGIKTPFLSRELGKLQQGKITHYCMPEVCRSCGVC